MVQLGMPVGIEGAGGGEGGLTHSLQAAAAFGILLYCATLDTLYHSRFGTKLYVHTVLQYICHAMPTYLQYIQKCMHPSPSYTVRYPTSIGAASNNTTRKITIKEKERAKYTVRMSKNTVCCMQLRQPWLQCTIHVGRP